MRAYSTDLREKALAALDRGEPRRRVAATFGVSASTLKRYLRLRAAGDGPAPWPIPGRPARKGDALRAWLPDRLEAHTDATLAEHRDAFAAERGMVVSIATVCRAIASLAPPPDQALTPRGHARRPGRPLKQRP